MDYVIGLGANLGERETAFHDVLALLDALLAIEVKLGRVRRERWGPRTLDLDILWAEEPLRSERLTIPHPGLCERAFALTPLLDVAPELRAHFGPFLDALGGALAPVANVRSSTNAKL